jgi:heat shock protein HtpX
MGATARTLVLFMFMFGLFMVIGWAIGGLFFNNWVYGAVFFLILAGVFNLVSYFYSSKIVLWSYRAKIVNESEAPRLHRSVRRISALAGMPMPRVTIVPTETPNAFATGRNPKNAVVAATRGILKLLDDEELDAVIAHEMAHVKDRDILVMSIAATLAGAISFAARWAFWGLLFGGGRRDNGTLIIAVVVAITVPIAAVLIQLAISRSREYKADEVGAMTIGRPMNLAKALRKLEQGNQSRPIDYGNPASESLWIVNPFRKSGGWVKLFATHPPMEERIRRLQKMANSMGQY